MYYELQHDVLPQIEAALQAAGITILQGANMDDPQVYPARACPTCGGVYVSEIVVDGKTYVLQLSRGEFVS